jgi:hypothetical protein
MKFKKAEQVPDKALKNLYSVTYSNYFRTNAISKVTAADEIEVARFIRQHKNANTVHNITLVEYNVYA